MRVARRVECDASRRALELICRMFIVGSFGFGWRRSHYICCSAGPEDHKMDIIVPLQRQSWRMDRPASQLPRASRRALPSADARRAQRPVLFARVVDEGSFSRAAERLGLPKSTVSRRVAALETQLGERLLLRTTRKLTITDFGLAVLEHARHVVEDVAAAASLAQNRQVEPSGRLRVTMPSDMASIVLAPLLAQFVARVPGDRARDRPLRALRRSHRRELRRRDSHGRIARRRVARRTADRVFIDSLYAAPAYLARRGTPSEPEALMEHDTLRILGRTGDPMPWVLRAARSAGRAFRRAARRPILRSS